MMFLEFGQNIRIISLLLLLVFLFFHTCSDLALIVSEKKYTKIGTYKCFNSGTFENILGGSCVMLFFCRYL